MLQGPSRAHDPVSGSDAPPRAPLFLAGRTVTKKVVHYAGLLERAVPPVVPKAEILDGRWVSFAEGLQLLEHDYA